MARTTGGGGTNDLVRSVLRTCHDPARFRPSRFTFVELMKAARAVGWGIGLVMLFVQPIIGLLILMVALVAPLSLARQDGDR